MTLLRLIGNELKIKRKSVKGARVLPSKLAVVVISGFSC
jgi:hypothetical protein